MPTAEQIQLHFRSGTARLEPFRIRSSDRAVIGRGTAASIVLEDEHGSISRTHLEVAFEHNRWIAKDLGSKNGTTLHGKRLIPNEPVPINHGSVLQLGNWELTVVTNDTPIEYTRSSSTLVTIPDEPIDRKQRFERVQAKPLTELASHRLATLLECSDRIHSCESIAEASEVALDAMLNSTGYHRGAFVRLLDESDMLETVNFRSRNPIETIESVQFSKSLLAGAADGDIVRLTSSGSVQDYGQSIAELDIHSALCIPVMIGESPVGYLYLDARGSEHQVSNDSSSFGRAIGNLLASTAANLRNKELEIERVSMHYDLEAAGQAQRMLLPQPEGAVGCLTYSMSMRPGRSVAGDLFGVVPLRDGRVCAFLGDVSGKGAGAAILMATTQSFLQAHLEDSTDLEDVVNKLNRHIAKHSSGGRFVTMWIGIFSPIDAEHRSNLTFIDAGHGHWVLTNPDAEAVQPEYQGGFVLGIAPEYRYTAETIPLQHNQRLVVFSDGIVEQSSPGQREEFGIKRARAVLKASNGTREDVDTLIGSVIEYAQSEHLDDDTTVASIAVHPASIQHH